MWNIICKSNSNQMTSQKKKDGIKSVFNVTGETMHLYYFLPSLCHNFLSFKTSLFKDIWFETIAKPRKENWTECNKKKQQQLFNADDTAIDWQNNLFVKWDSERTQNLRSFHHSTVSLDNLSCTYFRNGQPENLNAKKNPVLRIFFVDCDMHSVHIHVN